MDEIKIKIFSLLNDLCDKEKNLSDEELSIELNKIYDLCPINLSINHYRSDLLLKKRVKKYCDKNNIEIRNYNGSLPFRIYMIPVNNNDFKK